MVSPSYITTMAKRKHSEQDVEAPTPAPTLDPAELQDMKAQARAAILSSANAKIDPTRDEEFDGDSSFVAIGGGDAKDGKKRVRKDGKEKVK